MTFKIYYFKIYLDGFERSFMASIYSSEYETEIEGYYEDGFFIPYEDEKAADYDPEYEAWCEFEATQHSNFKENTDNIKKIHWINTSSAIRPEIFNAELSNVPNLLSYMESKPCVVMADDDIQVAKYTELRFDNEKGIIHSAWLTCGKCCSEIKPKFWMPLPI